MNLLVIVLLVCLLILVYLYFSDTPVKKGRKIYNKVKGNEKTPEIIKAAKDLSVENKPEEKLMAADLIHFNLEENADDIYAEALQLAIYQNDPIAFNINDRLFPLTPLVVNFAPQFVPHFVTQNGNGNEQNKLEIKKTVRSDPQNVHDSNVTAQLRDKCELLKETSFDPVLYKEFKNGCKNIRVVEKIEMIPSLHEYLDVTDEQVLKLVVSRGKHTWLPLDSNLKNIDENVCLTGRIGQIIDALTIVDEIGKPIVTIDIMRKEIMDDTANYLRDKGFFGEEEVEVDENDLEDYLKKKYGDLCTPEIFNKIFTEVKAGL